MSAVSVEILQGRPVGWRCDECPAHAPASVGGTPQGARDHASTHGHTVRFIVESVTVYRPLGGGA
jgi:hypothetical protein